jgi:hypothetical protein
MSMDTASLTRRDWLKTETVKAMLELHGDYLRDKDVPQWTINDTTDGLELQIGHETFIVADDAPLDERLRADLAKCVAAVRAAEVQEERELAEVAPTMAKQLAHAVEAIDRSRPPQFEIPDGVDDETLLAQAALVLKEATTKAADPVLHGMVRAAKELAKDERTFVMKSLRQQGDLTGLIAYRDGGAAGLLLWRETQRHKALVAAVRKQMEDERLQAQIDRAFDEVTAWDEFHGTDYAAAIRADLYAKFE